MPNPAEQCSAIQHSSCKPSQHSESMTLRCSAWRTMFAGLVLAGAITDTGKNKSTVSLATADRDWLARPNGHPQAFIGIARLICGKSTHPPPLHFTQQLSFTIVSCFTVNWLNRCRFSFFSFKFKVQLHYQLRKLARVRCTLMNGCSVMNATSCYPEMVATANVAGASHESIEDNDTQRCVPFLLFKEFILC